MSAGVDGLPDLSVEGLRDGYRIVRSQTTGNLEEPRQAPPGDELPRRTQPSLLAKSRKAACLLRRPHRDRKTLPRASPQLKAFRSPDNRTRRATRCQLDVLGRDAGDLAALHRAVRADINVPCTRLMRAGAGGRRTELARLNVGQLCLVTVANDRLPRPRRRKLLNQGGDHGLRPRPRQGEQ